MRNYQVGGRQVAISERELDCFRGVAKGGTLVVTRGAGPFDVKVASFSRLGFDRSPNREDLLSLLRKGVLTLISVNGRVQVGLTPDGKTIAESMGVYSLSCMVRDAIPNPDRPVQPVVAEEPIYTEADFSPTFEEVPEPEVPEIPEDPEIPNDQVIWKEAPPPPEDALGDRQEGDDSEVDSDEVVQRPVYDPMPGDGAKFADLQAYAAKYDIDVQGLRSKKAVRAAIEAVVLQE